MSNKPVQTFREGQIAASVWERAGRRGTYFEMTVSRSFRKSDEDGFGYSPCFRARDVEPLKQCVEAAAAWILSKDATAEVEPDESGETPAIEAGEPCDL